MAYLYLALAIIMEVTGTMALKASNGFTLPLPSFIVALSYAAAFILLGLCIREISVGVVYATWAGLGIVLVAIAGAVIYRQIPDIPAMIGFAMIIAGVVVIHLFSKTTGQ